MMESLCLFSVIPFPPSLFAVSFRYLFLMPLFVILGIITPMEIKTKDLATRKVWTEHPRKDDPEATKKVGRIHAFVFHPKEPRLVGFLVKRPDIALMFHRKDLFVAFNGWHIQDGDIVLNNTAGSKDRSACKELSIDLDECVIWVGLPVITQDGTQLGVVDSVTFDDQNGRVLALEISQGTTANALLGQRTLPPEDICGFKRGIGTQLYMADDDDERALGALLVKDTAKDAQVVGGAAEKAGTATAVAKDKVTRTYKRMKPKVQQASQEATKAAVDAVEKGVYATGKQIGRTKGMFKNFKDEFKKGMQ